MGSHPQAVDIDALGKLLSLAKSLDEVFKDTPRHKAIERVLIRTTNDGHLAFQVKGGMLWRFFTITLPGRESEYDLGKNFAELQNLFEAILEPSDQEIRRAAQGMAMYGDTVIDTTDSVASLIGLQNTLNSIIDLVLQKKLRRCSAEERRKNIIDTLEGMKINWRQMPASPLIRPRKSAQERKLPKKTSPVTT